jgi:hypothetical protein
MKPTPIMRPARLFGMRAEVEATPLGVVGIIGPWNFPLNLVVLPAAAAFAAGNRVMIKMSEITPATAELMRSTAPSYFDTEELEIVTGGTDVAREFSRLPFDHLFFTGSPSVGALVARAATENLVPVTLELGGKNPVVVAPDADLERAATRIAQARMVNGGQVCVCPDYVFVPEGRVDAFVERASETWRAMFPQIVANADYCSSVNEANFRRVVGLIDDARDHGARVDAVIPAGETLPDPGTRKIAPTIVRDVDDRMRIAEEEVFGPVLTVLGYRALGDAIDYVNARPRAARRVLVRAGRHRLPPIRRGDAQRRCGPQRLRRADDPVCRPLRRRGTQRHGRLPRQGRVRRVQPPAHGGRDGSAVQRDRFGSTAVHPADEGLCRPHAAAGTPPHQQAAATPPGGHGWWGRSLIISPLASLRTVPSWSVIVAVRNALRPSRRSMRPRLIKG